MSKFSNEEEKDYYSRQSLDSISLGRTKEDALWNLIQGKIKRERKKIVFINSMKITALFLFLIGTSFILKNYYTAKNANDLTALLQNILKNTHHGNDQDQILIGNRHCALNLEWSVDQKVELTKGLYLVKHNDSLLVAGNSQENELMYVKVPPKKTLTLVMNDGTSCILNANSILVFNGDYKGKQRTMALNGGGRFDVVHDPNRPMYIIANNDTINDIGTTFYVQCYKNNQSYEVAVQKGAVNLYNIRLKEGEMVSVEKNTFTKVVCNINQLDAQFLNRNEFIFSGERMDKVLEKVANWYGYDVVIPSNMEFDTFTGKVPNNLPASVIVGILNEISGEIISIDSLDKRKTITIKEKKKL